MSKTSKFGVKKRQQQAPPGRVASTAEVTPGIVGRGEQGEARTINSTPNGGPHLELGRLRLKTWSKSDFSIAQTTSTYLHMSLYRAAPERAGRAFPRLVSLPLVPRKRRAETFDYPHVLISRETPTHELHQKHEAVDDRNTRPPPGQGQAGLRQKSEIKHHTIKGRKTLKSRMKDGNTGRQKGRETVRHDRQTE